MNLKLYHTTGLVNVNSILEKGLIRGYHISPYQDWKAKYSGKGIYFCSEFMDISLDQAKLYNVGDEKIVYVVIEVNVDVSINEVVPDEEEIGLNNEPKVGEWIELYNDGGAIVILRDIKPHEIKKIYYPNIKWIKEYVDKFIKSNIVVPYNI